MRPLRRLLLVAAAVGAILLLSLLTELFGPGPGGGDEANPPPPPAPAPPPAGRVVAGGGGDGALPADLRVAAITREGPVPAAVAPDGTFTVPAGTVATAFEATAGSLRVRTAAGGAPVTIRLPERLTVAGRIVDGTTGEAVAGATVVCGKARGESGPRGRFRLEGVALEAARLPPLRVSAGGYADLVVPTEEPRVWEDLFLRLVRR